MPTLQNSGTVTTDGTEQTLGSAITSNKVLVLGVDTGAMVNGDTIELRIYTKILSGGTERLAYYASYSHAQGEPNKYSIPVPADVSWKATIKRTAGSDRSYPWSQLSL